MPQSRGKMLCRPGTQVMAITWSPDGHDVCIAYADGFIIRGGFAGSMSHLSPRCTNRWTAMTFAQFCSAIGLT